MSELRILGMAGTSCPFSRSGPLIVWTRMTCARRSCRARLVARRTLPMVLGDQLVEPFAAERCGRVVRQRRAEETLRQRVFGRRPAGKEIELALGGDNATRRLAEFVAGGIPPRYRAQHSCRFAVEILEDAAQELAHDERVHQGGSVLGFDGVPHGVECWIATIDFVRKIHFVGRSE